MKVPGSHIPGSVSVRAVLPARAAIRRWWSPRVRLAVLALALSVAAAPLARAYVEWWALWFSRAALVETFAPRRVSDGER